MTTTKRYYGDNLDTLRRLSTTSRFRQPTILLGFLVTSLLLYATALDVGFIHDDFVFLTIRGVDMFSMSHTIYRPFGLMLFAAFNQLAGDAAPIAIHAFGIAAHAFCAYLLFRLTYALTGHSVLSLLAALAWLSSPAAVAPVYWSSAVIFYPPMTAVLLITMLYAHRAFGSLCQDEHPATGTYLKLGVTLALVGAVGLMFHEQALVLPVLLALLLYGGFFYPRPRVRVPSHLMLWAPTALVALLYGATRVYLQAPPNLASYTVSERTALLPYAVWRAFMPTERFIWHVVHPVATLHPLAAVALVPEQALAPLRRPGACALTVEAPPNPC